MGVLGPVCSGGHTFAEMKAGAEMKRGLYHRARRQGHS